jgi:hypothetical protein
MKTWHAVAIDLLWVVVFATVGRASHAESLAPAGVLSTAWPFLVSLAAGWVTLLMIRTSGRSLLEGAALWFVTVFAGLIIRISHGTSAEVPFIIVAALFLAAGLIGWRLVLWLVERASTTAG